MHELVADMAEIMNGFVDWLIGHLYGLCLLVLLIMVLYYGVSVLVELAAELVKKTQLPTLWSELLDPADDADTELIVTHNEAVGHNSTFLWGLDRLVPASCLKHGHLKWVDLNVAEEADCWPDRWQHPSEDWTELESVYEKIADSSPPTKKS